MPMSGDVPSVVTSAPLHDPASCELCSEDGGIVLFRHPKLRIVQVDDVLHPGFCRVIWNTHVAELTDLPPADRSLLMMMVCKLEQVMRDTMAPHKINLASLGNMTPHLHWHVIPRYEDDAHFPQPVWGQRQRTTDESLLAGRIARLPALHAAILAGCTDRADSADTANPADSDADPASHTPHALE